MDLHDLRDTWDELGRRDAMWAVLSGPLEGRRVWTREAFFQTGVDEVEAVLRRTAELGGAPGSGRALDFGCGIGRLSQALALHFSSVDGVDISPAMLEQARQLNRAASRCIFHLNDSDTLAIFPDGAFDFVYSSITLQHMEPRYSRGFIREFFRVTRPGGVVVFQIPSEMVAAPPVGATRGDALPPAAMRAEIQVPAAFSCAPGARVRLPVTIRNAGNATWPVLGAPDGTHSIRLGNHWRHRFGWMVRFDDVRAVLTDDLSSGEEVTVDLVFEAPLRGTHIVELDMVQEGHAWFATAGSRTARIRLKVDPELAPGTVTGLPRRMEMHGIRRPEVETIVRAAGGEILAADDDDAPGPGWTSYRYVTRRNGG
jgi:SAM-dependent methyltransferase